LILLRVRLTMLFARDQAARYSAVSKLHARRLEI
jgi:hypothetical protein